MTFELLTNEQMAKADRITIESGVPGYELMKNAGRAAVEAIAQRFEPQPVKILCGPGNNGGDGFVIAKLLRKQKWDVSVYSLLPLKELKGDALNAASEWDSKVDDFSGFSVNGDDLVIDAVFGTGFDRDFEGVVREVFAQIEKRRPAVIAVDIPSGVNGTTGAAAEFTPEAILTLTFCRKKLGHVLMPGAAHCGEVVVCDIGIPDSSVIDAGYEAMENHPGLWADFVTPKAKSANKYSAGHTVIFGGPRMTGAACMAAGAALRIGSGLCTIAGNESAADVYRSYLPNIIFEPWKHYEDFRRHLEDERRNAVLIGPGAGLDDEAGLRRAVLDSCSFGDKKTCVLDADSFTAFKGKSEEFCRTLHEHCILTPHEGEFSRVFPDLAGGKIERCRMAAELCGAVVLLKGPDTVICHPDGRTAINSNAPPTLATGGSGDVLAGIIAGLAAQGTPPFEVACAGAWIHGEAASLFGPGLTAPDIIDEIPEVLREFT